MADHFTLNSNSFAENSYLVYFKLYTLIKDNKSQYFLPRINVSNSSVWMRDGQCSIRIDRCLWPHWTFPKTILNSYQSNKHMHCHTHTYIHEWKRTPPFSFNRSRRPTKTIKRTQFTRHAFLRWTRSVDLYLLSSTSNLQATQCAPVVERTSWMWLRTIRTTCEISEYACWTKAKSEYGNIRGGPNVWGQRSRCDALRCFRF